jgi:hypothetical protein
MTTNRTQSAVASESERRRITVRQARKEISLFLTTGKTVSIGDPIYGQVRGFIVGVPTHNHYNQTEKRKALRAAKAAFQAAWMAEWEK